MRIIEIPSLYPLQEKILQKAKPFRFIVLNCGRRFGKTTVIINICTAAALGQKIYVFAPAPSSFSDTWRELVELVGAAALSVDKTRHEMIFANGGWVKMVSLHDKGQQDIGRGVKCDWVIYEETQSINTNILKYHFENVMTATLMDSGGRGIFIGTPPNNKMHYFAYLFCLGAFSNYANCVSSDVPMSIHFPKGYSESENEFISFKKTAYDNPYILDIEIEKAKKRVAPIVFQQEFLARFVDYNTLPWLSCFDEAGELENRIFRPVSIDHRLPFYISFDFNLSPMAATIWQKDEHNTKITCLAEFGAPLGEKVSIQYTTDKIKEWFLFKVGINLDLGYLPPSMSIFITGDATGSQKDPRAREGLSFYQLIEKEFQVAKWHRNSGFKLRKANPSHKDSWQQMNNYFAQHKGIAIDINCTRLRNDIKLAPDKGDHEIDKKQYDPHFLDTGRYFFANFLPMVYGK